jgi:hypothetical protein
VFSYYKAGKSCLSISQHLVAPHPHSYANFYISHQQCMNPEYSSLMADLLKDEKVEGETLIKIFRVIIEGNLQSKGLGLDFNSLKTNPYIQKMVDMKTNQKFITKTSQIIIVNLLLLRMKTLEREHHPMLQMRLPKTCKLLKNKLIIFLGSPSHI